MSSQSGGEWFTNARGALPIPQWTFTTDAPLADLRLARETGEVIVADQAGSLYLLDRRGRIQSVTRTRHKLQRLAWSDTGHGGALAYDNISVGWIDRQLQFAWTRDLPDEVLSVAVDPHGSHVAISTVEGVTTTYSNDNQRVSRFQSLRPLRYTQFLATSTDLIGAAEHGLVARYSLRGEVVWSEKLWTNIGDMSVTGDGAHLFLGGYALGVQVFDGESGHSRGTFVAEGTVNLVSCAFMKKHLVATTLERHLFGINDDGNSTWYASVTDDIARVQLSPLGDWMIIGFASGRIMRLDCN